MEPLPHVSGCSGCCDGNRKNRNHSPERMIELLENENAILRRIYQNAACYTKAMEEETQALRNRVKRVSEAKTKKCQKCSRELPVAFFPLYYDNRERRRIARSRCLICTGAIVEITDGWPLPTRPPAAGARTKRGAGDKVTKAEIDRVLEDGTEEEESLFFGLVLDLPQTTEDLHQLKETVESIQTAMESN